MTVTVCDAVSANPDRPEVAASRLDTDFRGTAVSDGEVLLIEVTLDLLAFGFAECAVVDQHLRDFHVGVAEFSDLLADDELRTVSGQFGVELVRSAVDRRAVFVVGELVAIDDGGLDQPARADARYVGYFVVAPSLERHLNHRYRTGVGAIGEAVLDVRRLAEGVNLSVKEAAEKG